MAKKSEIDPFLPFVKVARASAPAAAALAPAINVTYQHARGALVLLWEGLADRRLLARHLEAGAILLSDVEIRHRLRLAFGVEVDPELAETAGFLERRGDLWRVRGGSRLLAVEGSRLKKKEAAFDDEETIPDPIEHGESYPGDTRGATGGATRGATGGATPGSTGVGPPQRLEDRGKSIQNDLGLAPAAGGTKRSTRRASVWEDLHRELSDLRAKRLQALELDPSPQELAPSRLNQLLRKAADALEEIEPTGAPPEERADDLIALYRRYLWSSRWRRADPPFPLEGFATPALLERLDELFGAGKDDPVTREEEWA